MNLRLAPVATWLLFVTSVLGFLSQGEGGEALFLSSTEALREAGAADAVLVWQGEVWRLVTALFVHAGFWHLGLNMWVLMQVGRLLERLLGTARFVLVYFVSGTAGFAASVVLHPGLTAGASGAIFGVVGGLLSYAFLQRHAPVGRYLVRALLPFVAATLLIGWLLPFVDNTAHLGGLCMGMLLTLGLLGDVGEVDDVTGDGQGPEAAARPRRALRTHLPSVALVGALSLFAVGMVAAARPTFSPRYNTAMGLAAVRAGDEDRARDFLASAERASPQDPGALLLRARLLSAGDAHAQRTAKPFYEEALRRYDDDPAKAMALALLDAGFTSEDEPLFGDVRLAAGLCRAATRDLPRASPLLLNNCAWLLLQAEAPEVHSAEEGLRLAELAVARADALSGGARAALWHTLAEAKAQLGAPGEARAMMERVSAEGWSHDPLYESERERFAALARALAQPETPVEPAAPSDDLTQQP
ncbi:MAG: rhomboid family intramembrane serine protease [Myxococcota bacterium]